MTDTRLLIEKKINIKKFKKEKKEEKKKILLIMRQSGVKH